MKHDNNFDFLRVLFSLLVVLGHTIVLSKQPEFYNEFLATMPNYSVFSFYVISGFLVFSSFSRLKNLKTYFFHRAKRILPAYWSVVLFFAFFLYFFASGDPYFSRDWWQYLGANMIFLNFLKPCLPHVFVDNPECAVNGALWTIKVEILFYLFLPILFYIIKKMSLKKKNLVLIGLYCLSIVYFHVASKYWSYTLAKQLPGSLTYFLTGIFLFLNLEEFRKKSNLLIIPAILIIVIEKLWLQTTFLFPLALGTVILWFAYLKLPLQHFGKYGDFSYGMYLIHFPVIQIFISMGWFERYSFAAFFLLILVVVFLSVLSWNLIEKPFVKKKINRTPLS